MSEAIQSEDRAVIRELARQLADIAALPVQEERRRLWQDHNSLRACRPLFRILPEGSWREILPDRSLRCQSVAERRLEFNLRSLIQQHQWRDDGVIDGRIRVAKTIHSTGWGVEPKHSAKTEEHGFLDLDPVIKEPDDLKKMRHPVITYNEAASRAAWQRTQDLVGDILVVELSGAIRPYYHLMGEWTELRGLEQVMVDMYENPGFVHEAMSFLTEGHQKILAQSVQQKLLASNHDGPMINQGAHGYVDGLPATGFDPAHVRASDCWAVAEAQELTQVSPEHHAEFALTYERKLLQPFPLNCYGCCEDLTQKLDHVVALPGMRRISISPWSNLERCSEFLQGNFVMCWKPQPSYLVGNFDENVIRQDLRSGLESAMRHGSCIDFILKDTHTCENHPERFDRWAIIAREEITRAAESTGLDAQRAVLGRGPMENHT